MNHVDDMKDALRAYRRSDGSVNVPAFISDDLWHVLGSFYSQSSSRTTYDADKWKNAMKKLVRKVEIAIKRNIDTDAIHRGRIDRHIRRIKEAIDAGQESELQAIAELLFLTFELMGGMPNNREVKHATKEGYFDLRRHRTVHYLQSPAQKAALVLDAAEWGMFKEHLSVRDIADQYWGKDKVKFLAWFKEKYPAVYAQLF